MAKYRVALLCDNYLYIAESARIPSLKSNINPVDNDLASGIMLLKEAIDDYNHKPVDQKKENLSIKYIHTTRVKAAMVIGGLVPFEDFMEKILLYLEINGFKNTVTTVLMSNIDQEANYPIDLLVWELLQFPIANGQLSTSFTKIK